MWHLTAFLSLLALATRVSSAKKIDVPPGVQTISSAIASAGDGDILQLAAGNYIEQHALILPMERGITLTTKGSSIIQLQSNSTIPVPMVQVRNITSTVNGLEFHQVTSLSANASNTTTGKNFSCQLTDSSIFTKERTIEVTKLSLAGGRLIVNGKLSDWFNYFFIKEIYFGGCSYSRFGPSQGASATITAFELQILSDCTAGFTLVLRQTNIEKCTNPGATNGTWKDLRTFVQIDVQEVDSLADPGEFVNPVSTENRITKFMGRIRMSVDRFQNVMLAASLFYSITDVIAYFRPPPSTAIPRNKTTIELLFDVQPPLMLQMGINGTGMVYFSGNSTPINVTKYQISDLTPGGCANLSSKCTQSLSFDVGGCMPSGDFTIANLTVGCRKGACPAINQPPAQLQISLASPSVCSTNPPPKPVGISGFSLFPDNSFSEVASPDYRFPNTGATYWSFDFNITDPNTKILKVEIINGTSFSDAKCQTDIVKIGIGALVQTFSPPSTLKVVFPFSEATACGPREGEMEANLQMSWTIQVLYLIDSQSRSRRQTANNIQSNSTQSDPTALYSGSEGDVVLFIEGGVIVDYNTAKAASQESGGGGINETLRYVLIAVSCVAAVFIICLVLAVIGFVLYWYYKKSKKDDPTLSMTHSGMQLSRTMSTVGPGVFAGLSDSQMAEFLKAGAVVTGLPRAMSGEFTHPHGLPRDLSRSMSGEFMDPHPNMVIDPNMINSMQAYMTQRMGSPEHCEYEIQQQHDPHMHHVPAGRRGSFELAQMPQMGTVDMHHPHQHQYRPPLLHGHLPQRNSPGVTLPELGSENAPHHHPHPPRRGSMGPYGYPGDHVQPEPQQTPFLVGSGHPPSKLGRRSTVPTPQTYADTETISVEPALVTRVSSLGRRGLVRLNTAAAEAYSMEPMVVTRAHSLGRRGSGGLNVNAGMGQTPQINQNVYQQAGAMGRGNGGGVGQNKRRLGRSMTSYM